MNQRLAQGRTIRGVVPTLVFSAPEEGRVDGKRFVRFRLSAPEQGLTVSPHLADNWDPRRAQAIASEITKAIEKVMRRDNTAAENSTRASTLLTATNQ